MSKAPDPGVYPDTPEQEYRDWEAENFSHLKNIHLAPARYVHAQRFPMERTPAMRFGSAFHRICEDSSAFTEEYVPGITAPRSTKAGHQEWVSFIVQNVSAQRLDELGARLEDCPGDAYEMALAIERSIGNAAAMDRFIDDHFSCQVMSQEDLNRLELMWVAVDKDTEARKIFDTDPADREVSFVWKDPTTGILCKGRIDYICRGDPTAIVDLKTAKDGSPESHGFPSTVNRFFYHAQMAMYAEGWATALGVNMPGAVEWVVVESQDPHLVQTYRASDEMMNIGSFYFHSWLERLAQCRAKNEWPGYSDGGVVEVGLPGWAYAAAAKRGYTPPPTQKGRS